MQETERIKVGRKGFAGPVTLVLALLATPIHAQSQATLNELIQSIKAQREAALNPARAQVPHPEGDVSIKKMPEIPAIPMVWSITGINEGYAAILVVERKAHRVSSTDLPQQLGPWRVQGISEEAVVIMRQGQSMTLRAPDSTSRPEPFIAALTGPAEEQSATSPSLFNLSSPPGVPPAPASLRGKPLANPLPINMRATAGGRP